MFSIATPPAKQSVGETINVLSGRLNSATLLEDRRAAILGLRSFAKEYPASVASGALRSLIGSLAKDGEDVDTVKVVLETLLMLFNPNGDSPEASDEIALWLADEFTQRQENITLLLDFLDTADFYARLYSLQLLIAILAARTDRTEECVFTAPLGISRLVAVLDDRREAVRNEALTLLTYLTPTSIDIQKLVAFENAFERVFSIIKIEGSLAEGGRIVEDCLIFLANLLRLNSSNQSTFRETGCIPQLARLLASTYRAGTDEQEVAAWAQEQHNRNIYALLAVVRLFLAPGAVGTPQNQVAFSQHSILEHALQLAFSPSAEVPIKAEALTTCADIIRGNSQLQVGFAQFRVPSVLEPELLSNGHPEKPSETQLVYVIDGLLDLTLSVPAMQVFDLRLAACQCIKAYFFDHPMIRLHFLRRAIDGHASGVDETANVLTALLRSDDAASSVDPYRRWFAAVILFHLIYENSEAKALAMAVAEGDEANGEEVVTSIQTITAHLISGLNKADDERVTIGYLMLLMGWLWEDLEGVDDFLGEGSNIQSLAQAVVHPQSSHGTLVKGLCVMLLGVVYEFSTKDSPIPRATLQAVLLSRLGRDKYIDTLSKLRSHPALRDFEVLPQKLDNSIGTLPDVFFDTTFVDFFKDNYSRLVRAIDREPGIEISVVTNGVQKGISRELVDTLRAQLEEKDRALQAVQASLTNLQSQFGQEQADHRRSNESSFAEIGRIKHVNEALQKHHEEELQRQQAEQKALEERYRRQLTAARAEAQAAAEALGAEHRNKESELQRQLDYVRKTAEAEAARVQRRAEAEMADLKATISRLEVDLMKSNKARTQESHAVKEEFTSRLSEATARTDAALEKLKQLEGKAKETEHRLNSKLSEAANKTKAALGQVEQLEKEAAQNGDELNRAKLEIKQKAEEKQATQTELDDLLMVFNDLEEKVERYKDRLTALGEAVSDAEDGDEEGDEEDEEVEDEEDEEDDEDKKEEDGEVD